ncbi:MAG: hypothetical protein HN339_20005, partial [Desulfobacula sp.]|uniref:hypothetical protein n=1 Tax=Desulfobacula sp. TaxID=2593537 RepID=UPI0039B9274E|nr:hypothetical protein [Desulfobacula sp.]
MEFLQQNHILIIGCIFTIVVIGMTWLTHNEKKWIKSTYKKKDIIALGFGVTCYGLSSDQGAPKKYKGFLNLETINNKIIEGHLRLNGDYFIYNKKMIDNFINFYITENYKKNIELKEVFFFPVFISKDINFKNIKDILKKV